MRRSALAAGLLPLTALVACDAEAAPEQEAGGMKVPAGVAEQYATLADEVDERGGQVESGDWTVSYIVEAAEPWHERRGGEMHFREPAAEETHHLEIIPVETSTGRIVPDVPITLEVIDADGKVVDAKDLRFLHSTFFHYAENFEVPEGGPYTLRATLGAAGFAHHGAEGERPSLSEGTVVEFDGVDLALD